MPRIASNDLETPMPDKTTDIKATRKFGGLQAPKNTELRRLRMAKLQQILLMLDENAVGELLECAEAQLAKDA